jgi:indolepyruvate ferredoxin oxidoreductase beta subunit
MDRGASIIITGHGGQGVLSASKLMAEYYFLSGLDVKTSTLIGLGIRGGGVYSHLKSGTRVISPLIKAGEADMIIGLEKLETIRWIDYLKKDGMIIMNNTYIQPTTVSCGLQDDFEGDFKDIMGLKTWDINVFDGYEKIKELGNNSTINMLFLGICSELLNQDETTWRKVIENNLSAHYRGVNELAFSMGRGLASRKEVFLHDKYA